MASKIIAGIRYGNLVTTGGYIPGYKDGDKRVPAKTECKCDCGSATWKTPGELRSGNSKSCSRQCMCTKPKIIPGTRYGHLIATGGYVPQHMSDGQRIKASAEFNCDCGVNTYKSLGNVVRGMTTTCGSMSCIYRPDIMINKVITISEKIGSLTMTGNYKRGSKKRGEIEVKIKYEYQCDCGNIVFKDKHVIDKGKINSCGHRCPYYANLKHGNKTRSRQSKEYVAWKGMKNRCNKPDGMNWMNYGGRGIKVCKEWEDSFLSFLEYIGKAPSSQHSLDRIDNDGNYEPGNVRWATHTEQVNNRRPYNTRLMHKKDEIKYLEKILEENSVTYIPYNIYTT